MPSEKVSFLNPRGLRLVGVLELPDLPTGPAPGVVLSHGFTGFKEVKYLVGIGRRLREHGYAVLRFDFSDCIGESQGDCEHMRVSYQVGDLTAAIDYLASRPEVDAGRIGLGGHSLGALTSIVVAASDRRPKALVSIASPARRDWQNIFDEATVARWEATGMIDFPTFNRGHVRIHHDFYEEMAEYEGLDYIARVHVPVLFLHGTADDIVPPRNSVALYQRANEPKALELLPGANHFFLDEASIQALSRHTLAWYERWLG
ncbi:MAG: alpha/beta fold hydrolase [Chloroflexota bacterium]|nr:alpha/beta fold hydrolase [Chloroflexota bacterium]